MSAIHASMKEPTVMFALIFCAILFQAALVMLTAILANIGVGEVVRLNKSNKFLTNRG